jgi:hypothetical protein
MVAHLMDLFFDVVGVALKAAGLNNDVLKDAEKVLLDTCSEVLEEMVVGGIV